MIKGVLLIVAIFIFLFYFAYIIYTKQKNIIKYVLMLLIALIGIYNLLQQSNADNIFDIKIAFENNKKIICKDIEVNKNTFNLVSGTNVFLSKKDSIYKDYILPLDTCIIGK
jgi:hypothetical protein